MPEPYTHAVDTDTMCGILDTHAANTMNQMPMELMPIEPMPMPCVASSGGDRHLCSRYPCRVWHLLEVTVTDAYGTDTHAVDADAVCGVLWR